MNVGSGVCSVTVGAIMYTLDINKARLLDANSCDVVAEGLCLLINCTTVWKISEFATHGQAIIDCSGHGIARHSWGKPEVQMQTHGGRTYASHKSGKNPNDPSDE